MEIQVPQKDEYLSATADEVLAQHSDMVYRLALAQMRSTYDAEDIFQDVFLKYMEYIAKPRSFRDSEHLKAWLIRVTLNRCRSIKASAWFKKAEALNENIVFETKEENNLFEYLELLSGKFRTVIHLFYGEDMSIAQISKAMKAKESTVRTWLTRARGILREKLEGDYFDE